MPQGHEETYGRMSEEKARGETSFPSGNVVNTCQTSAFSNLAAISQGHADLCQGVLPQDGIGVALTECSFEFELG